MTMRNQITLQTEAHSLINQSLWDSGWQTMLTGNTLSREKENIPLLHIAIENIKT
jgi:hypothetical protein